MTPLDRRDFVKAGAGTALGVSLAPAAMLGRVRRDPRDRLRLGFIGVGGRGTWLLGLALRRVEDHVYVLKAVGRDTPELLRQGNALVPCG